MTRAPRERTGLKDENLAQLARDNNVAQFVSFGPDGEQRRSAIRGLPLDYVFLDRETAVRVLLERSDEQSLNIRAYTPAGTLPRELIYGIRTSPTAVEQIARLAAQGFYTIANETIPINDGGVSGVVFGDIIEFAPDDTPRSVERPGTLSLPVSEGLRLLKTVYGFVPAIDSSRSSIRHEFSLHPNSRGLRREHTISWETEEFEPTALTASIVWPNRFSRFLGDKAFGLLIAATFNLPVPKTTVISRRIPPFVMGEPTGTADTWLRTCPQEPTPGRFPTFDHWQDPFPLLEQLDPQGTQIASMLAQEGVRPRFSGALLTHYDGGVVVEGVAGRGDEFMLGTRSPEPLPTTVYSDVHELHARATSALGAVRLEWVHDGQQAWIVQIQLGATTSTEDTFYPGTGAQTITFRASAGLEALRALLADLKSHDIEIIVEGDIGLTSHFGDLLRRSRIPSRRRIVSDITCQTGGL